VLQFRGKRISTCQSRGSWRKKNVFCMNNARACYPCESFEQRGLGARSCGWLLEECFLAWTEVHISTVSVLCGANGCDTDRSRSIYPWTSTSASCVQSQQLLLLTLLMHCLLCTHYLYHTSPKAKQTSCSREAL
jgi:hypothetical protein